MVGWGDTISDGLWSLSLRCSREGCVDLGDQIKQHIQIEKIELQWILCFYRNDKFTQGAAGNKPRQKNWMEIAN
jgi:hypothetical protein